MKGDRGFVLINALVVVAAVSALSVGVLHDANAGLGRLEALRDADRAELALDGGAVLVTRLLNRDAEADQRDHLGEDWLMEDRSHILDTQTITLTTEDLQGRFNLNMLLRPDTTAVEAAFVRLAEAHGIDPATTDAILEHYAELRNDPVTAPLSVGDGFASREPVLIAELDSLLPDMSALDGLKQSISLLPKVSGINLNTAREDVVLALLGDAAEPRGWDGFDAARRTQPIGGTEEALRVLSVHFGQAAVVGLDQETVTTFSGWFELRARVEQEDGPHAVTFLLHRSGSPVSTDIIARIPVDG